MGMKDQFFIPVHHKQFCPVTCCLDFELATLFLLMQDYYWSTANRVIWLDFDTQNCGQSFQCFAHCFAVASGTRVDYGLAPCLSSNLALDASEDRTGSQRKQAFQQDLVLHSL